MRFTGSACSGVEMSIELIRATNIKKSFSNVIALAGVDFNLQAGEVHALLGENGSGKSTLMKIFSGVYTRDSGDLYIKGKKVGDLSPKDAQNLGVGCIFQELNLCPHLTVAENIFLGREYGPAGVLDRKKLNAEAKKLSRISTYRSIPMTWFAACPSRSSRWSRYARRFR